MNPKKEYQWHRAKGKMQLFKNKVPIREYNYHDAYNRRRMLRIWDAEVKPNGKDEYYLIIKPLENG
jgi:hypothetical protein